jgi:hypothetical protein
VRPARKADNLTAICESNVYRKCGSLNVSQSYGPQRPVTGVALLFIYVYLHAMVASQFTRVPNYGYSHSDSSSLLLIAFQLLRLPP